MDIILEYLNDLTQINAFIFTLLIILAFISFNILAKVIIENLHESYNSIEASKKINHIYFNYIYTSISVLIIIFNLFLLCHKFDSLFISGIITLAETLFFMIMIHLIFNDMSEKNEFQLKNRIFGVVEIFLEFIL